MAKIIRFPGLTRLDLNPMDVIEAAKDHISEAVIVIGYDKEGEYYFASSLADGGDALWLIEKCKLALLDVSTDDFEE